MKTIKKIRLGLIEITFQYEDQYITIKAEPFKTLGEIKEKAIKKMICVPNNIICFYLNLDLSNDENKKVGDIFKHKEKVIIKLKQSNNNINTSYTISQSNNKISIKNISSIIKNNNDNINIVQKKPVDKNLFQKSIFFQNPNALKLQNSDNTRMVRNKSDGALGILPLLTTKTNRNNKNNNSKNNSKSYSKNNSNNHINLCGCKNHIVSDYCRVCRKFICNTCKLKNHKEHLTIRLNLENLENNVNLYGNLIQTDIKNMIELNKNILQNKKEIIDINLLEKHKEDMNSKYQEIIDNYTNMMKKIKKYLDKENEGKVKLLVNAYNSSSVKIQKELYDLIEKLKAKYNEKNQREIKFNELEYYLNEINNKEGTLAFFKKDIIKYHLTNEINDKLKNSLDKINNILDEIINEENPFNLDKKYYQKLINMKIINLNLHIDED